MITNRYSKTFIGGLITLSIILLIAWTITCLFLTLPTLAESESGGFVLNGGSESGGADASNENSGFIWGQGSESGGADASSESNGVLWGRGSESGGPMNSKAGTESGLTAGGAEARSGAESESGGIVESGKDDDSGRPDVHSNEAENKVLIRTYHW